MQFNYMYGKKAEQYSFIHIPKLLVKEDDFINLTLYSKVLYGLLLDRMGIAVKNEWFDSDNRMYVIYPLSEIKKDMGVSIKKAAQYLDELEVAGLIEKRIIGKGYPNAYYVKDFAVA